MSAPRRVFFTEFDDKMIISSYRKREKGAVARLAKRLNVSTGTISRRAATLGCTLYVKKTQTSWTDAERDIVEANAHKDLTCINYALKKAGYPSRSLDAINHAIRRLGLKRRESKIDAGIYTQKELALMMNVDDNTINRHIKLGHLKAKQRDTKQIEYEIHAKDIKKFIVEHLPNIDIGKCDKYWLIDILTGAIK